VHDYINHRIDADWLVNFIPDKIGLFSQHNHIKGLSERYDTIEEFNVDSKAEYSAYLALSRYKMYFFLR